MKWSFLMVASLALACVATFAPIRSTPPMLLSSADGVEWNGVDFNELRAQARRALYLNELTSSVRSYVSANVELPSVEGSQKKGSRCEKQNSSSVRANTLVSVLYGRRRRSPCSIIHRERISACKSD